MTRITLLIALAATASCTSAPDASPGTRDEIHALAKSYPKFHRIDDWAHWAPGKCEASPARPYHSESADAATHGRKLYSLFAKNRGTYISRAAVQPVGQVIVKESWVPEECAPQDGPGTNDWFPYAEKDGKTYKAATLAGLFIMMKSDPATPGTDQGWTYATTDVNGKIIGAGLLQNCMSCHQLATTDRMLFGKDARDP